MLDDLDVIDDLVDAGGVASSLASQRATNDVEYEIEITNTKDSLAEGIAFVVERADLVESLSEPYELRLTLTTHQLALDFTALVGADAAFRIVRDDTIRECKGVVSVVTLAEARESTTRLDITIVPAFAFLKQRTTRRIFQDQTARQILEQVLDEGLQPFGRSVDFADWSSASPRREYTVQHDETDFAFCSRLMEEEGVSYCFHHGDDVEAMLLVDRNSGYSELDLADGGAVTMLDSSAGFSAAEGVRSFAMTRQAISTGVIVRDFDWTVPSAPIDCEEPGEDGHGRIRAEYCPADPLVIGDYDAGPQRYQSNDRDRAARIRRARQTVREQRGRGHGWVVAMQPGRVFSLIGHAQASLNTRYLITRVHHHKPQRAEEREAGARNVDYRNEFECIPLDLEFVSEPRHARPRVDSIQIARVCGPEGEEIHTDEYGRVLLHFAWDREGEPNAAHSAWVRVRQQWAGSGWGHLFIPHVGMEVLVAFVDGNPDRPVVTGCAYNADSLTPYPLPDEKYKSTIKTVRNNELRFDDTQGAEEIYVHAQRNLNEVIEADHSTSVGGNQVDEVHGNQDTIVDADQLVQVRGYRQVFAENGLYTSVTAGEERVVTGGFNETIDGGEERTITGNSSSTITGHENRTVNGPSSVEVTGGAEVTVHGGESRVIHGCATEQINGDAERAVEGAELDWVTGNRTVTTMGSVNYFAAGDNAIRSDTSITLTAPVINLQSPTINGISASAEQWYREYEATVTGVSVRAIGSAATTYVFKWATGVAKADLWEQKVDIARTKITNSAQEIKVGGTWACLRSFILFG